MKDATLSALNKKEEQKQREYINLIASENYVSRDVREAIASVAINKYSEGYPGKRYYPGNEFVDQAEELAKKRALKLFGLNEDAWCVNVQPYSGSPANLAVYYGVAKFLQAKQYLNAPVRDVISKITYEGMRLDQGGHLTHGHPVSFTGDLFNFVHYGVTPDGLLNYAGAARIAENSRPALIVTGATAYPRVIDFKIFSEIAKNNNALLMADISHIAGLVAAKEHPSPFQFCDIVTTTTHKTLRGPRGAMIFTRKGITAYSTQKQKLEELYEFMDRAIFPGLQGGPHDNQTMALAVALLEALTPAFKTYQKQVVKNAKALANELMKYGFTLMTGGTDNHLILIDLRSKNISGADAEKLLYTAGIIANRNAIPNDPAPPFRPSGLRIGTPAITTRGAKEKEMKAIAALINEVISNPASAGAVKKKVLAITKKLKNV